MAEITPESGVGIWPDGSLEVGLEVHYETNSNNKSNEVEHRVELPGEIYPEPSPPGRFKTFRWCQGSLRIRPPDPAWKRFGRMIGFKTDILVRIRVIMRDKSGQETMGRLIYTDVPKTMGRNQDGAPCPPYEINMGPNAVAVLFTFGQAGAGNSLVNPSNVELQMVGHFLEREPDYILEGR